MWGWKQIIPCFSLGFLEAEPKPKILVQGICLLVVSGEGAREAGPGKEPGPRTLRSTGPTEAEGALSHSRVGR